MISGFAIASDALYVHERDGTVSRLLRVSFDGKDSRPVPLPFEGSIQGPITDVRQPGALFGIQGWVQPRAAVQLRPGQRHHDRHRADTAQQCRCTRSWKRKRCSPLSYDGTRIPLSIVCIEKA